MHKVSLHHLQIKLPCFTGSRTNTPCPSDVSLTSYFTFGWFGLLYDFTFWWFRLRREGSIPIIHLKSCLFVHVAQIHSVCLCEYHSSLLLLVKTERCGLKLVFSRTQVTHRRSSWCTKNTLLKKCGMLGVLLTVWVFWRNVGSIIDCVGILKKCGGYYWLCGYSLQDILVCPV